jgi:formylglycine-generating enzyme required for sulfatase activity
MVSYRARARTIAGELIAEIVREWKSTRDVYYIERSGYHLFEFVIESTPYARIVLGPQDADSQSSANSSVRFNPLAEATEIVFAALEKTHTLHLLEQINDEERNRIVRRDAKAEILNMIRVAPDLFRDAVWQAQLIGGTTRAVKQIIPSGRLDIARGMVNSSLTAIQNRLKKRFPKVSKAKKLKISDAAIASAIEKFLPQFRQTRALPSQRQFAIAIGVSPKAWRLFLTRYDLDKHEVTIKQWYEFILAKETNPDSGDFPPPT